MTQRLESWLQGIGLAMYCKLFADNQVDLEVLPDLTEGDLRDLGIPLGHRKKLLRAIAALAANASTVDEAAHIAPGGRAEGERRQLTVMFCDLVDSTALSSRLDPEDLRDVIRAYQIACSGVIAEYGGHIAKYLGDGVLAYFGFPKAHEDDAQRAARAALAIVATVARTPPSPGSRPAVDIAVRIGIDTGLVVVGEMIGDGASREASVIGETPNVAARLQALAPRDQIVVGPLTYALMGDAFTFVDLGPVTLKGMSRPIQARVLSGERHRDARLAQEAFGPSGPLVGRREELALMLRAWDATKHGRGQAVLVRGDAGIGKSRLTEAFRAHCSGGDSVFVVTACSPYHASATLHPLIEHLKRAMDWNAQEPADTRLAKLETHLAGRGVPVAQSVPLYAELLSLPIPGQRYAPLPTSAQERREQLLDALAAELVDEAEHGPVVRVWEDVQWADPTTLQLLGRCIDQSATIPLMNVITFRSDFTPPWMARSHVTSISLTRLEGAEIEALVVQSAAGKVLPREVVEYVLGKTDGVPLYVEEMTKALIEGDFLREENGAFTIVRPLSDVNVPSTLHDLLMARLDRLPTIREIAQLGSILGREFAYEMLQAIASLAPSTLHSGLDQLVDCELLYQRGSRPHAKYIFKHALIHDAAYQSLLKRTRQHYHLEVAHLLESRYPDTVRTQPEMLAHHYSRADAHEKAIGYLLACSDKAAAIYAHADAVAELRAARTHAEQLSADVRDQRVLDLVIREAQSLHFLGHRDEIVRLLVAHRDRLEAPGAPALAGEFHFWLGFAHSWLGHREEAAICFERGLRAATDVGDMRIVGRLHRALATECFYSGRPLHEAVAHAREAVALLTGVEDRFWLSQALFTLSYCCTFSGDFDAALDAAHRLSAFADATGAGRSRANSTMLAGLALATRGEGEAGVAKCEQALAVSPDRFETAFILACLGKSCLEAGHLARAVAVLEEAVALADEVRSLQFRVWFKTMLAEAYLVSGNVERASALAATARQASAEVGFVIGVGLSEHIVARIALAQGDGDAARQSADAAISALDAVRANFELARARLTSAAAAKANQEVTAAELRNARAEFAAMGAPRYAERADELAR